MTHQVKVYCATQAIYRNTNCLKMNILEGRGDNLVSREPRQRPEGLFDNHPHKVRAGAESESG